MRDVIHYTLTGFGFLFIIVMAVYIIKESFEHDGHDEHTFYIGDDDDEEL